MARSVTTPHAPLRQAALGPGAPALDPAGRGDEIDIGHEAALLVRMATIMLVSEEMSLPPPVPGGRILGLSGRR